MEKTKTTVEPKNNDKKSKLITAAVVAVLILIFVVGFVYGLNSVLAMEGAYPPETDTHGIYDEPKTNEEIAELLNKVVIGALDGKPKTAIENEFDVDGDSIEISGTEELKKTVLFAKDGFEEALDSKNETVETDFAEELKIRVPKISADDIESFECKYFSKNYIYQCDICGAESYELLNGCPECGSGNLYVEKGRGEYVVSVVLKNNDSVVNSNFAPRDDAQVRELIGDEFDGTLSVGNVDVKSDNIELYFKVNRDTGELTYLEYKKDMTVKTDVTFTDKFASLGKADAEFKLTEKVKNSFTWPSLELSEEEMVIEPKKSDNLTATLTCADPTKPVVTWKSSDENVVTVDDEGYMKAGKEPGEAVITATFDFLGKTYTDTCLISVKIPVESMAISKRSIKLNAGETKQIDAKVSPSNATVQTKKWYSEDESIATVDENGNVTAVKSGTVAVYALSDDGFYKSTCEVTVK